MSLSANGTASTSLSGADSDALLAEFALLISSAQGFQAAKTLAVACFCWLIYDHVTTFDQEVSTRSLLIVLVFGGC